MYSDDSPDYSAPGPSRRPRSPSPNYYSAPGSSRRQRSPSPSYSPPRSRRNVDREYSAGSQRGARREHSKERRHYNERRRSRSRSPQSNPKYLRRSRSSSNERLNNGRYDNARNDRYQDTKPRLRDQRYPWEDEETLRSLHCKDCNVTLNDRDSMMGHLKGTQHLMQLRRLKDNAVRGATGGRGLNDVLIPNNENFDENFWYREKGPQKLRPEQERFLDTKRLDAVPAKFDSRTYDNGQYRFDERENYCEDCDVWVRSRDQMQAHKEGANHKKKSAKVHRYQCKLCLIEVPCQDTLDNHMRGKDHIKREKQLMEQRRQRGGAENDDIEGYKTGPAEMAKLNNDEVEELKRLRREVTVLRKKVREYQEERVKCAKEHRTHELDSLRKRAQFCLENHLHQAEMSRGGLFVKKEEPSDDVNIPSTSYNVKGEPRHAKSERSEYVENGDIILD